MSKKVKYAIGVDLGATAIKIGMVSQSGEILKQVTVNTNAEEGPKKVINNIKMGIHTLLTGTKFNVNGLSEKRKANLISYSNNKDFHENKKN